MSEHPDTSSAPAPAPAPASKVGSTAIWDAGEGACHGLSNSLANVTEVSFDERLMRNYYVPPDGFLISLRALNLGYYVVSVHLSFKPGKEIVNKNGLTRELLKVPYPNLCEIYF